MSTEHCDSCRWEGDDEMCSGGALVSEIHVVFDGPPGPEPGRFVEVETPDGRSLNVGEWRQRDDGMWALVISVGLEASS